MAFGLNNLEADSEAKWADHNPHEEFNDLCNGYLDIDVQLYKRNILCKFPHRNALQVMQPSFRGTGRSLLLPGSLKRPKIREE
jgi:hypothetical protein